MSGKAGIPVTPIRVRRTGICRLFEKGLSIPEVSLISGHVSWNMLRRYTHLKPENVLEKLA